MLLDGGIMIKHLHRDVDVEIKVTPDGQLVNELFFSSFGNSGSSGHSCGEFHGQSKSWNVSCNVTNFNCEFENKYFLSQCRLPYFGKWKSTLKIVMLPARDGEKNPSEWWVFVTLMTVISRRIKASRRVAERIQMVYLKG